MTLRTWIARQRHRRGGRILPSRADLARDRPWLLGALALPLTLAVFACLAGEAQ